MEWTTLLTIILGGGNIVQLVTLIVMRNKNRAETESIAIKNMQLVIDSMQEEIRRLQEKNTGLEAQVTELQSILNRIHI